MRSLADRWQVFWEEASVKLLNDWELVNKFAFHLKVMISRENKMLDHLWSRGFYKRPEKGQKKPLFIGIL